MKKRANQLQPGDYVINLGFVKDTKPHGEYQVIMFLNSVTLFDNCHMFRQSETLTIDLTKIPVVYQSEDL